MMKGLNGPFLLYVDIFEIQELILILCGKESMTLF